MSYQENAGMPEAFAAHIQEGIRRAEQDDSSMLMFSGGQTRVEAGPKSEALSYFEVADENRWFGSPQVRARTVLEEFATDSFENLMFALCRFRQVTGAYPARIAVISFSFKRKRFEEVHRQALRFPQEAFEFVGVEPRDSILFAERLPQLEKWESKASLKPFLGDPFGCNKAVLRQKRRERNSFFRTPAYAQTCPEMSELLTYCGTESFPAHQLPWDL
jgi:hypothetical protein